jgi:16S rRNA (guanine966-N2)-methyltransferase
VIAGSARGVPLVAPAGTGTRPTTDRAKGAIANALWSMEAIEGARIVDLFAGTGSMSIELLSRGAAHATCIERDRAALAALRSNLVRTRLDAVTDVIVTDAESFLARPSFTAPYDLAIADPPYAYDRWDSLLDGIVRTGARLVVAETGHDVTPTASWEIVRRRRYGSTVVTFFGRTDRSVVSTIEPPL